MKSSVTGRGDRSSEVGEKHEGALQDGDEMKRFAFGIIGVDLRGQFVDARANLFGGK